MAANSLTERNDERTVPTREETRSSEKFIKPAVNIIETEEGLTLTA
ncbi:Hsp20/alpha crystallin family protein, partial [bacterium]